MSPYPQSEVMPAVFVSHGSPMVALQHGPYQEALAEFGRTVKPRAIVAISAHWGSGTSISITGNERHATIHDFGGFPAALYELTYDAPGSPELAARIEAILRRSQPDEGVREMRVADMKVDLIARSVERAGRSIALQPREFRLLAYLLLHQGRIVTRTMLLESVWDYRFDPQTNVIDVHISRLRSKIDKGRATPLLHTVRGAGYMIRESAR